MKRIESLSRLIENLEQLPSIGKKSATRLALYLIKNKTEALKLANVIESAVTHTRECIYCGNISEHEVCDICSDERRGCLCLVESSKEALILEENGLFDGYYFVMNRLDAEIMEKLSNFVEAKEIKEIVFAFTHSAQSDAMSLYIEDKLKGVSCYKIAHGVPTGVQMENVDITSLTKALEQKVKL